MVHENNNDNNNNHENTKEIKKTAPFPVDYVNDITKRSLDLRSEIKNLINQNPFLLRLDEKEEGLDSTKTDKNLVEYIDKTKDPFQDKILACHSDKNNNNNDFFDSSILMYRNKLLDLIQKLENINDDIILSLKNLNERYEQQKEFIDIAAHEIRGPSTAILGYIELLYENHSYNKNYLQSITRNAERLNLLVSNILDVSRIDNKTMILKKENFDLIGLINQVIEDQINQISRQKNIDIEVRIDSKDKTSGNNDIDILENKHDIRHNKNVMSVNADKARLAQVISNLLLNALKFTLKGRITVTIRESTLPSHTDKNGMIEEEDSIISNKDHSKKGVIVEVRDTGKGIDSKILPKAFAKFTSDPAIGGTGLGLFISKNIIEAHGGEIWAKNNEDGKGATFSFSLPKVDNGISNDY